MKSPACCIGLDILTLDTPSCSSPTAMLVASAMQYISSPTYGILNPES